MLNFFFLLYITPLYNRSLANRNCKPDEIIGLPFCRKQALKIDIFCPTFKGPDGQSCTMVIRTLHWTVPSYRIWGLPFFLFYSTRSSQFLHERPNQNLFRTLFLPVLSPMVNSSYFFIFFCSVDE